MNVFHALPSTGVQRKDHRERGTLSLVQQVRNRFITETGSAGQLIGFGRKTVTELLEKFRLFLQSEILQLLLPEQGTAQVLNGSLHELVPEGRGVVRGFQLSFGLGGVL